MPTIQEILNQNPINPNIVPIYTGTNTGSNTGNTSNSVPNIYGNMSTLSKFLTFATTLTAIKAGANQVPTAQNQQQYNAYNPYSNPLINPLTGLPYALPNDTNEKFGAKVQRMFEENTGAVLLGGGLLAAYLAKSPRRRNGIYSDAKRKLKKLLK